MSEADAHHAQEKIAAAARAVERQQGEIDRLRTQLAEVMEVLEEIERLNTCPACASLARQFLKATPRRNG